MGRPQGRSWVSRSRCSSSQTYTDKSLVSSVLLAVQLQAVWRRTMRSSTVVTHPENSTVEAAREVSWTRPAASSRSEEAGEDYEGLASFESETRWRQWFSGSPSGQRQQLTKLQRLLWYSSLGREHMLEGSEFNRPAVKIVKHPPHLRLA
jgi:hypothetical protein